MHLSQRDPLPGTGLQAPLWLGGLGRLGSSTASLDGPAPVFGLHREDSVHAGA